MCFRKQPLLPGIYLLDVRSSVGTSAVQRYSVTESDRVQQLLCMA